MAQPYAAYPPQGGYYPPGYDYSGYYQQAYDPNQAYWQQYGYGAAQSGQPAATQQPQPPQAPPLPADEPPPLPPDDATKTPTPAAAPAAQAGAEAGAASAAPPPPPPPVAEQAQGTTAASSGSAAQAPAAPAQAPQQQQQTTPVAPGPPQTGSNAAMAAAHYAPHAQYYAPYDAGGYYGGGYGAPPHPYGAPYGAPGGYGYPPAYGSYGPPANASYAPQVHQQHNTPYPPSSAPPPGPSPSTQASSAAAAAASGSNTTPSKPSRWNRAPPPACLTAGTGRPSSIKPASIVPASGAVAAKNLDATQVEAARQAAVAAAARISAGQHGGGGGQQQQQQFISVGSRAGAGAAGAGASSSQPLPPSFTQYVQRALLRVTGAPAKQEQLKEVLRTMIADHRKAGTMWSTDWDRAPLPAVVGDGGGGSPPAGGRSSVFSRMGSSPRAGGGGWDRGAAGDRGGSGGYRSSNYRDGDGSDDEDDSRGGSGGYGSRYSRGEWYGSRYGGSFSPRGSNRQGRSSKRGWDDGSRYGSSDDSDDERSDSRGDDDEGGWRGNSKWGKKKQRLALDSGSGGGRGKGGHGRKGQQQQQGRGGRGGRGGRSDNNQQLSAADAARAAARNARFRCAGAGTQLAAYGWEDDGSSGDAGFIVGTCQKLEKGYLRLTRPPAPDEVRPQLVLAAALARLLGLVQSKGDKYLYYNDQFKAMRQDLTVQGIKNDFTVQVYEAHARAALEYGDNAEYNQCQAQLAILYAKGLPGAHAEFGAYRLLYQAVYAQHGEGRKLLGTLRQLLGNRVGQVSDSPEVAHAMQVRQALANGNVLRFFALYASAPRLSRRLMDAAVNNLRFKALSALVRTHKPTVILLPFLARALGFLAQPAQGPAAAAAAAAGGGDGDDAMDVDEAQQLGALTVDDAGSLLPGCSEQRCLGDHMPSLAEPEALAACLEWCKRHGAVLDQETDLSTAVLVTKECWNKLFVPVDTSKVAHGDANLDIRDFLAAVS